MRTGVQRYCYEKKKIYAWRFIGTGLMVIVFFSMLVGLKTGSPKKRES